MEHSIVLIATGLSVIFKVHDASHGAGQILPVNSGKLLLIEVNQELLSIYYYKSNHSNQELGY